MLTRNIAYTFGLANGTRGKLVGVVYGRDNVGTFPVGTFPEAVVVDVPDYKGPQFYDGEPTWVPILPMTSVKEKTRMMRTQFPVVAGFALTVNKAQGLTLKEGVVIHLAGSQRYRPAAKHGLPFVAWTRSESFAMTAFKHLPPWNDFVKGRESDMLRMRNAFTDKLWKCHRETLRRHTDMDTPAAENHAHSKWVQEKATGANAIPTEPSRLPCPACAKLWY